MVSFILFNIYNFRPPKKRPVTFTVIVGEITSSNKYNNLKLGNAIAINIKAGVIVHINSINVKISYSFLYDWTISYRITVILLVVSEDSFIINIYNNFLLF